MLCRDGYGDGGGLGAGHSPELLQPSYRLRERVSAGYSGDIVPAQLTALTGLSQVPDLHDDDRGHNHRQAE